MALPSYYCFQIYQIQPRAAAAHILYILVIRHQKLSLCGTHSYQSSPDPRLNTSLTTRNMPSPVRSRKPDAMKVCSTTLSSFLPLTASMQINKMYPPSSACNTLRLPNAVAKQELASWQLKHYFRGKSVVLRGRAMRRNPPLRLTSCTRGN